MFARIKRSGGHEYVQIVENHREDGKVRQSVIATLGRRDILQAEGSLESLMTSLARLTQRAIVVADSLPEDRLGVSAWRIGGPMVFQRLWEETACQEVIQNLLQKRNFTFPLERILFATVLQRIFEPGSDRACTQWVQSQRIPGLEGAQLHHWYRAMAWLGEPLPASPQQDALPLGPRTIKDLVEEALFQRHRTLLTEIDIAFFDTTTLFFEGEGGTALGDRGHNKDGHPELNQMVVGVVMDSHGNPLCCEMWPGNTADIALSRRTALRG